MRASLALVTAALFATACGEDFDPYTRLTSLRVLAVKSEPVAPANGETTTLSALIYSPPDVAVQSYAWSWCPLVGSSTDGYPCLISEAELEAMAGPVPSYDLGSGETASFENSLDPALLELVCTGMPGQPELVNCLGGFPVQVKLVVKTADDEIVTVKTLRLRFRAEDEPNQNPVIDGLTAELNGVEEPLVEAPGPTLPRGVETTIRAAVAASNSESYTDVDDDGKPIAAKERLIFTWFVESGDVDSERTVFIDEVTTLDEARENTWEPDGADDYIPDTSQIIVVVRDNRDGVTWLRAAANLGAMP